MVVGSLTVETDVVVIGAGPGGYVAAIRLSQLGKDVIIVEETKDLGGICLHHGCIPTKALIHATSLFHSLKEAEQMGITLKDLSLDPKQLQTWKKNILTKLNSGIASLCKKYGIEVIEGRGVFTGPHELRIEGKSDVNTIKFQHAIIATGSRPINLPTVPFGGRVLSSTEALSLETVPGTIAIIGGGYIGTEMGTVFAKLGSQVHIIEMRDHLLPGFDEDIVHVLTAKLQTFHVITHLNAKAESYEEKDGKAHLTITEHGERTTISADNILVVVGRRPNADNLGLESAGVQLNDKGFITVDKQQKTTIPHIYAIGDVVGEPMLAHKASREAKVAAEVIAGQPSAFDNKAIPFVVFNDPEIASVGISETEAKTRGLHYTLAKFPFSALGRALTLNASEGFVKMISEEQTGRILGVHIIGPNASDLISEATLAIEMGATAEDIALTIHPHPTLPESLMEAAEMTLGTAIHFFTEKKK